MAEGTKGKLTTPMILPRLPAPGSESSALQFAGTLKAQPSASSERPNPLPVVLPKPSAGKGRRFNPHKPPAVLGFKWSPNGAGFDCRQYWQTDGKTVERFVGYLGKRKLAEFRAQAADREALREIIKAWIGAKLAAKGEGNPEAGDS